MRKISAFLIGLLILSACQGDVPLTFSEQIITEAFLEECTTRECPSISIQYLHAEGSKNQKNAINQAIEKQITNILAVNYDSPVNATSIKDATRLFISSFMQYETDFSGAFEGYEADIKTEVLSHTEELVSIGVHFYLFTGGAHGYSGTNYLNFDAKTGEILPFKKLFTDVKAFSAYAENHFREEHEIPLDQNINSTGFWFDKDTFHLPENIGFTDTEIILHYNQYEIASYAEGPVMLTLSKEESAPFLNYLPAKS